jgi:iron complex transport system substrate-binding protein
MITKMVINIESKSHWIIQMMKYVIQDWCVMERLAFVLMFILCISLVTMPVDAQDIVVSGDLDGDNVVSNEEMEIAEQSYKDGKITSDQLEEILHIHENYPRIVEDSIGSSVTIYKPVNSIIAPNSNADELLRAIGAVDKIIAVGDSTKGDPIFYPELSKLPSVGSVRAPDTEQILNLHPDLLILSAQWDTSHADALQEVIQECDPTIAVARFDCYRLENYEDETRKIAYLLEKETDANDFLEFYNDCVNLVVSRTSSLTEGERPKVYLAYGEFPPYGAYGGSAGAAIRLEMAGGNNIFGDDIETQYAEIDPEEIITKNPEVIIRQVQAGGYSTADTTEMQALLKRTVDQSGWEYIDAIKNNNVYLISKELQNKRYFLGLLYTAKILLPEHFKDMDPQSIHQEYLSRFQNLDIDLDNQGVFVYPPLEES